LDDPFARFDLNVEFGGFQLDVGPGGQAVIEPDVLSKDRDKFEASGDDRSVDKAQRRGRIGWNVGRHIEVAPPYRRPHIALM
jgi:hypothetical protein